MNTTILQLQSASVLLLLFLGIYFHKNKKRHIALMGAAVLWDILLILQIEFNRGAVVKAVDSMTSLGDKVMLNIHVSIAITTVILYFVQIYLGRAYLKKHDITQIARHRVLGYVTITMRILTFITSFFIK